MEPRLTQNLPSEGPVPPALPQTVTLADWGANAVVGYLGPKRIGCAGLEAEIRNRCGGRRCGALPSRLDLAGVRAAVTDEIIAVIALLIYVDYAIAAIRWQ